MKIKRLQNFRSGFTLIELLVSMAITVVLLGVLVYMTGISMDTYRDSRNEVRASRQAQEALKTIAKDLESLVSRRDGNTYEWLYAGKETNTEQGPINKEIINTSHLIFFTGATDRYNGEIGVDGVDKGGDVSAVSYRLVYKDQISEEDEYRVFSFYRHLVNPDKTFGVDEDDGLLAVDDLQKAYEDGFESDDLVAANFLVENVYEFTITFLVEYTEEAVTKIERVSLMQKEGSEYQEFRVRGNELLAGKKEVTSDTAVEKLKNGRIVGAQVSITVLTDRGLTLAKKSGISREDLVKKHSYHYTKTITTPRP